jgi:hypothetical protein
MDRETKAAWREVLKDLRKLQSEYEKAAREKEEHCASRRAAGEPKPLIDIER